MNRWIKRGLWATLVVALAGGGAWWFNKQRKAIDQGAITQVVLATGALQPVTTVNVGTQVSRTVLERLADFNDRVKEGQVLLRLDPAVLQARLRQAKAQLAASDAALTLAVGPMAH